MAALHVRWLIIQVVAIYKFMAKLPWYEPTVYVVLDMQVGALAELRVCCIDAATTNVSLNVCLVSYFR